MSRDTNSWQTSRRTYKVTNLEFITITQTDRQTAYNSLAPLLVLFSALPLSLSLSFAFYRFQFLSFYARSYVCSVQSFAPSYTSTHKTNAQLHATNQHNARASHDHSKTRRLFSVVRFLSHSLSLSHFHLLSTNKIRQRISSHKPNSSRTEPNRTEPKQQIATQQQISFFPNSFSFFLSNLLHHNHL